MSRRHSATPKKVAPDSKYGNLLVARFINNIMQRGKKSLAEKSLYKSFEMIEKKHKTDPFEVFLSAVNNVKPFLEVVSVRVGGANYQVPTPVNERRGYTLSFRWIKEAALKRGEKSMTQSLAEELFDAHSGRGGAIKKREDTHKMAEANKAFAHFSPKKTATTE